MKTETYSLTFILVVKISMDVMEVVTSEYENKLWN